MIDEEKKSDRDRFKNRKERNLNRKGRKRIDIKQNKIMREKRLIKKK